MNNFFKKHQTKVLWLLNIVLAVSLFFTFRFIFYKNQKIAPQVLAVTEITKVADALAVQCKSSNNWHDCYKEELSKATKTYGLKTSTEMLYRLQAIDPESRNCHVIAHFMSREGLKRDPGNLNPLLDELDVNTCGSGFLHGVLEAYVGMHPELKLEEFANEICDRGTQYRKRMCAHFMGHVFLLNTEGNLDEGVALCHKLKDEWKFDCFDGLFMEDHQKLALVEHEVAEKPILGDAYTKQMEEKCASFKNDIELSACWTEMAEMYAHTYGYNPDIIYKNCQRAARETDRRACYGKGIVVAAVYTGFDAPEKLNGICKFFKNKPQDEQWCLSSMQSALIYYSPKFIDRGITACNGASKPIQNWCYESLNNQIRAVMPDLEQRLNLCGELNETDKQTCLKYEI